METVDSEGLAASAAATVQVGPQLCGAEQSGMSACCWGLQGLYGGTQLQQQCRQFLYCVGNSSQTCQHAAGGCRGLMLAPHGSCSAGGSSLMWERAALHVTMLLGAF